MKTARPITLSDALRVGMLEVAVVLVGLVFVRKEVYLTGQYNAMILHWQEYALLILMFIDGVMRGFGELHGQGEYMSPFRKQLLRYLLPFMLFLFVSCSSLCDKLNAACIHEEWWRDLGLLVLGSGVFLCVWSQRTQPPELSAPLPPDNPATMDDDTVNGAAKTEHPSGPTASTTADETTLLSAAAESTPPKEPAGALSSTDSASEESGSGSAQTTDQITSGAPLTEAPDSGSVQTESAIPVESESFPDPKDSLPKESASSPADDSTQTKPESFTSPSQGQETQADVLTEGPWKILRYPGRTSMLLELVGISMTLSAWMPLVTLPGLFVLFKWELADLEAFRISQFGQKYLNYKKRSWNLIPYIY